MDNNIPISPGVDWCVRCEISGCWRYGCFYDDCDDIDYLGEEI